MASNLKTLSENDSEYLRRVVLELGVNYSGMARLLDCSNAVGFWKKGYRRIPKAFRRAILMLKFINQKGLMSEFLRYVGEQEKQNAEITKDC